MKIVIGKKEIQFKYFFFTIVIPNKDIKYTFEDLRYAIGAPISLKLESKHTKIISRFGILGKIIYFITNFLFVDNARSYTKNDFLTAINHKQNIEKFLLSLQNKNYEVSEQLDKLKNLANEPAPRFINQDYIKNHVEKLRKNEKITIE